MNIYLEIPDVDKHFPFRSLVCGGDDLTYPHWHKEIEIIYVTKGSLNLGINDVPIRMEQGKSSSSMAEMCIISWRHLTVSG